MNRDNVLEGAKLAFGQPVETRYDFEKADVILSLDADFLYAGFPGFTRYARDFAKRRNPDRRDEPAVCCREHAELDGREGGSPAAGTVASRSSLSSGRCATDVSATIRDKSMVRARTAKISSTQWYGS